jgi:hypothetical protein
MIPAELLPRAWHAVKSMYFEARAVPFTENVVDLPAAMLYKLYRNRFSELTDDDFDSIIIYWEQKMTAKRAHEELSFTK